MSVFQVVGTFTTCWCFKDSSGFYSPGLFRASAVSLVILTARIDTEKSHYLTLQSINTRAQQNCPAPHYSQDVWVDFHTFNVRLNSRVFSAERWKFDFTTWVTLSYLWLIEENPLLICQGTVQFVAAAHGQKYVHINSQGQKENNKRYIKLYLLLLIYVSAGELTCYWTRAPESTEVEEIQV